MRQLKRVNEGAIKLVSIDDLLKPLLTRVLNLVETMKEDLDDSLSWIEKVTDKFELD